MKAEQVDQALRQKFVTEDERLVFWHDPRGEFEEYVAEGLPAELAEVQLLDVAKLGGLSAKLKLEREEPSEKFLIYTHGDPVPAEQDWLFDIRLYSAEFHADVASLWQHELGLANLSIRPHLQARKVFLGSQERRKKLARFVEPTDDEAALDLKMIAVVATSDLADPFEVLRAICHGHVRDDKFDLGEPPAAVAALAKMGLLETFWGLMEKQFAYAPESPTLAGLLRGLFITEFFHHAPGAELESLSHLQLSRASRANVGAFLTQWRDSNTKASSCEAAASAIEEEQGIADAVGRLDLDVVKNVFTFWAVEGRVLSALRERVAEEAGAVDVDSVGSLAAARSAGHWLSGAARGRPEREAMRRAYDAILAAAELFALRSKHGSEFHFSSPEELLLAYHDELYRFDRLYRRFFTQFEPSRAQGWNLLKKLADEVERLYDQGFLRPLGLEWSRLLDAGFLDSWSSDQFPPQQEFYRRNIAPHLAASDRKRAFVIISDAFRYEAAKELTENLKGRYAVDAELSAMLGVLPSYTELGMASLLPHATIAYRADGEVVADGKRVAGTDARSAYLGSVDGMACKAKDLLAMKIEEARDFTQGKRVIYIYHNVIDARGDTASTESETFDAVSDCIRELQDLVGFCFNKLNAAKVWVTADHGFLFQEEAPDETDKTHLRHKPETAVKSKKRYVIGPSLGETTEAHHGSIETTSGATGGMEFWAPRGANRFHFVGGARFLHGGAMPQEVMVPLVVATQLRGGPRVRSKSEKVGVQVLGTNHRITTPVYRFELLQIEPVGDRRRPVTVRAAVYEGGRAVTSVATVAFDSTSGNLDERKKSIRLELSTGTYDKKVPYRLVLRDVETDAEVLALSVVIDRSFDDDF